MRISIVTLSYNQVRFLRGAIDSIVGQGYPALEYVVVDPGSNDGSRQIIQQYGTQISRLIFEPDAGPADGLNKGFASSTGDIFGYVNADDALLPDSLQYVSDYFETHPEVDVLLGCGRVVDENGKVLRHIVPSRFSLLHYAFKRFEFIQQAVFFRRSIFDASGGFNISNRISWDAEQLVDMAIAGACFGRSNKELGAFRIYSSSISGSMDYKRKVADERIRLFRKVMGRDANRIDPLLRLLALLSKWILDPWYVGWKLIRNPQFYNPYPRAKNILAPYVKPLLRPVVFKYKLFTAEARLKVPCIGKRGTTESFAFIIGCGRSGTTILGDILSTHPDIRYFFEPWHLWRAIDRSTDVAHMFGKQDSHIIMKASSGTDEARYRFNRLFVHDLCDNNKIHIEKTPHNAMRIGYLEVIAPNSKYIHIVRDGVDVASSIEQLIRKNPYRLAFRKQYNLWWGESNNKWHMLKQDGVAAGYFPSEAPCLITDLEKGAYEWLVSLSEIDRYRKRLGDRFLEIRYSDLVDAPARTLETICDFLNLEKNAQWIDKAISMLRPSNAGKPRSIELPPEMSHVFNDYQERYGFTGRAISSGRSSA